MSKPSPYERYRTWMQDRRRLAVWGKLRTTQTVAKAGQLFSQFAAALTFYSCLPIPYAWSRDFRFVARWAPAVGLVIGALLLCLDAGLSWLTMPVLVRSALLVTIWLGLTGGLHLDGAMDAADGLATPDPDRRLEAMADSRSGAFGVMAAIALLLLKTTALAELEQNRGLALLLSAGWGRWSQQVAIARYPYLKPNGKGAFHKAALPSLSSTIPSLLLLLSLSVVLVILGEPYWRLGLAAAVGGGAIAVGLPAWFHRRLGGHTGDTYGAVVEWTEALFLVTCTLL